MTEPTLSGNPSSKLVRAIAITGLIAGTMDITGATLWFMIRTGNSPIRVLEFIASAAFGREQAFSGNILMSVAGLFLHYFIAYSWTCLFFLTYPKIGLLRANRFIVGIIYGVFVWTMMNLVVLPMTRIPASPFDPKGAAIAAFILVLCIGLPISIMSHGYYSEK